MAFNPTFTSTLKSKSFRIDVDVTGPAEQMARDFFAIRDAVPRISRRAVNELARWARDETIPVVAKAIGQETRFVRNTRTNEGSRSRFKVRNAVGNIAIASLTIQSRGIQYSDIAGPAVNPWNVKRRKHRQKGGGVRLAGYGFKGKKGAIEPGAFKGRPYGTGRKLVFKVDVKGRPSTINEGKIKLFVPRIGIYEQFNRAYREVIAGPRGEAEYRKRFERLAQYELYKAGLK